jgi:hypothetical protein
MKSELRRKICLMTKKLSERYHLEHLIENEEIYKQIVKNDADNFLITPGEVDQWWSFIKKLHKAFDSGRHPLDIRINENYDF